MAADAGTGETMELTIAIIAAVLTAALINKAKKPQPAAVPVPKDERR